MKIINQDSNAMVLKDGKGTALVYGVIFTGVGLFFGYQALLSHVLKNLLVPVFLLLGGLAALFTSSSVIVLISKLSGQVSYQKKRLMGGSTNNYAIANIFRVETRQSWQSVSNTNTSNRSGFSVSTPNQRLVSQSFIVFKDGTELPIDHQCSGSSFSVGGLAVNTSGSDAAVSSAVATFLGVPFQEIVPPDASVISMGNKTINV